jgi:DNA-binding winged helix-turn-helix (wHTH) protein/tetratricopeptide (TPR) repeat protein
MIKSFRAFQLDTVNECLWRQGARLALTRKEYAILHHLVEQAGRLVTKEELMEVIWPGTYVQEEILKTYIRKLRQSLGDSVQRPLFIETQVGRGYRFIAHVKDEISAVPDPIAAHAPERLFGRKKEWKQLQSWYEKALRGERQIVFVTGEPGIGKTALTEAFLEQTAQRAGGRIVTGQCIESYREQEAYYPVLEAVARLCQAPSDMRIIKLLEQHAPTWLVQFPSVVTPAHRKTLQREILGATRERMRREFCQAIEALTAETPLVLVLEDLHWADFATLDLISALARRSEPARLLLLATYRPVEVILSEHPLKQLKRELRIQHRCQELPLDQLTKAAVAEYLAARFGSRSLPGELTQLIHEQTNGNPLFMVTAVEYLVAHHLLNETHETRKGRLKVTLEQVRAAVPKSLQELIERRIEQLSVDERALLTVASVVGIDFTAGAVAAGTGWEVTKVEECCDNLAQRQMLLNDAGLTELPGGPVSARYQFTHALYCEVLYRRCSSSAKVKLHQLIGEGLEKAWAGNLSEIAAELVRHFQEGRDFARVVKYLRLLAHNSERRYAYQEASAFLETAQKIAEKLPEATRGQTALAVLEQLAKVHETVGERAQAAELYQTIAARAVALGHSEVEASALINVAHQGRWFDARKALVAYERAAQIGSRLGGTVLQAEAEANAGFVRLAIFGWRKEWVDTITRWTDWMYDAGERECFARNVRIAVHARMVSADYEEAARTASEGKSAATEVGATASYFYCCAHSGWSLTALGRFSEAVSSLREGLKIADRLDDTLFAVYINAVFAALHCEAFDFSGARTFCDKALRIVHASQFTHALEWTLVTAATVELGMGDYDKSFAYLSELQALYDRTEVPLSWYWKMPMCAARCEVWLARGDVASARTEAELLRELSDQTGERAWQARAKQTSARVAIAAYDLARAETEIIRALAMIDGMVAPLVARRIYETAAEVFSATARQAEAGHYYQLRKATLHQMANSFAEEEPLRQSLLNAI